MLVLCYISNTFVPVDFMQVTLPPELAEIVQSYLLTGHYHSPIDVLSAGLQRLQAEERTVDEVAAKIERFRRSGERMDSLLQEHGLSADELVSEFRQLREQGRK